MSTPTPHFDVSALRAQFPALNQLVEGRPPVYFDNPGGTQVSQAVIDAMRDYLVEANSNTHGMFRTSQLTDATIAGARAAMADFLNSPSPQQIVFGPNMTTLTFQMSRAIGQTLGAGDEIVAEAGSGVATGRPAGSTPYLGETGMEMQFRDGATAAVLGECRDTQIGRKYAVSDSSNAATVAQTWASGYLNSFQEWSYAKNAFDKWSALTAQRLAALRGVAPPK